jgi:hypothetical protein
MADFEHALKRLVEDRRFRDAVADEPSRLSKDFKGLEPHEILLLMQVWHATGDPNARSFMITLCHCCCGFSKAKEVSQ